MNNYLGNIKKEIEKDIIIVREYNLNDHRIKVYRFKDIHTIKDKERWLKERSKLIGSSEVGIITNDSPYGNICELYLQKVFGKEVIENKEIMEGLVMEDVGIDLLRYYELYDKNTEKIRTSATIDTYKNKIESKVINEVYADKQLYILEIDNGLESTMLSVSPDAFITFREESGVLSFPVDIKRVGKYVYETLSSTGIGKRYMWQSFLQQLVYQSDMSYLFLMIFNNNGLDLDHIQIYNSDLYPYLNTLITKCNRFYDNLQRYKGLMDYDLIVKENSVVDLDRELVNNITSKIVETGSGYEVIIDDDWNTNDEMLNSALEDIRTITEADNIRSFIDTYIEANNVHIQQKKALERLRNILKNKFGRYKELVIKQHDKIQAVIKLDKFIIKLM